MNNQDKSPNSQDLATQALNESQRSDQFAETLQSLEQIIERNANQLYELKENLKKRRQMLKNYFENDAQLAEAEEQATDYKNQVKERKIGLQLKPQVVDLQVKIKELRERQREIQETLSNHLVNHHRMTNSTSFDTSDGDQWEYQIQAKIKAKPKRS
jgi:chromosome segregation ATPase